MLAHALPLLPPAPLLLARARPQPLPRLGDQRGMRLKSGGDQISRLL